MDRIVRREQVLFTLVLELQKSFQNCPDLSQNIGLLQKLLFNNTQVIHKAAVTLQMSYKNLRRHIRNNFVPKLLSDYEEDLIEKIVSTNQARGINCATLCDDLPQFINTRRRLSRLQEIPVQSVQIAIRELEQDTKSISKSNASDNKTVSALEYLNERRMSELLALLE
ncbi:Hypothetical_protein [Hexamita inflata]|uniref:Hypothetical_protein n=1 Tax=Hexamita inflata TaxID=28002 RepID=A0AA86P1T1_9EUKA|nr:Hypothetical protein HINF_LOCUS17195 [Hexamita inflata]